MCLGMTTSINSQTPKIMQTTEISKDQQDVLNAVESMTKSFNGKDIEGVMSSYQSGALVIFEPESPVTDTEQLRDMFLGAFSIDPIFEYPKGHEVFVNGDTATHIAPWVMNGTAPDGTKIQQSGLSIANLKKQVDGKWLLTFDNPHGNFLMNK
jgi:ketosteroid isomerase-like protein